MFPDDLMEMIVDQTNHNASKHMDPAKYMKWDKLTLTELKAYFGFNILMGLVHIPCTHKVHIHCTHHAHKQCTHHTHTTHTMHTQHTHTIHTQHTHTVCTQGTLTLHTQHTTHTMYTQGTHKLHKYNTIVRHQSQEDSIYIRSCIINISQQIIIQCLRDVLL